MMHGQKKTSKYH